MSRLYLLQRAIEYENSLNNYSNNRKLKFYDAFIGYQYQGMLTNSAINTTLKFLKWSPECGNGLLYQYDPRCRFWFKQTLKYETLIFMEPNLIFSKDVPYVGSTVCQKLYKFNYEMKQKELFSVLCIDIQLISIQNYFQNFAKSTKQFYLIEPRSQKILYNSKEQESILNNTIYNFNQVELINLQSKSDALLLNNTINQYFTTWVNETQQKIFIEKSPLLQTRSLQINYNRNGTQTTVILSPVTIIDKTPKYQGYQNWDQGNTAKFNIETPYLQINIITNEDLKSESKKVEEFFQKFFIIVSILLGVLALISILVTIFYSLRIRYMVNKSIDSLTFILEQLNDKDIRDNIFSNYVEEMLLSKEARKLYESFKGIYQILLTTSENFFQDNETITLLKLNKNIEFFQQFGNIDAVGIAMNNVGSILLSQKQYLQALDYFSSSIIYAKYQINQFCKNNPYSVSSHLLADYSYDPKFYLFINQQNNNKTQQQVEISGSINLKKLSDFNKSQISTQTKLKHLNNQNQRASKTKSQQINNSNLQVSQKESINNKIFKLFKGQLSDSKLLQGYNKNYLQTRLNQYSQDQGIQLSFTKYNNEEYYEQRIELLSNLYFRKKNYIIALIAFQENTEQISYSTCQKTQNKRRDNLNSQENKEIFQINNYYWVEIKQLLNELISIAKQLPFGESQELEIYSMISKCQYQLKKKTKSMQTINQCQNLLNQLKMSYSTQQKCDQEQNVKKQSVQNPNGKQQLAVLPKLSSSYSTHITYNNIVQQDNSYEQKQKQGQLNQINELKSLLGNQIDYVENNNINKHNQNQQGFNFSLNEQQEGFFDSKNQQSANSTFHTIKNINHNNNSFIPLCNFQISHQLPKLEGDNQNDYLNSEFELNQKDESHNFFTIPISRADSGVKLQNKNSNNSIKQHEFSKILSKSQQSSSPIQQSNQLNKQKAIKNSVLFEKYIQQHDNKLTKSTFCQCDNSTQKLQDLQRVQSIQTKRKTQQLLMEQQSDIKISQGLSSPIVSQKLDIEELFSHHRQVQNIIQDDYQLLNCLSIQTQDLIIKFTKTELLFKQREYQQAASILTQLIEDKKYLMSYYPYKIFNLLKQIFDEQKIISKEINLIVQKFNPDISIQIGMVMACFQHHKQIFKSSQLVSNFVSNILVKNDDQFGLILVDKSDNYIQTYMELTKTNQIKNIMSQIIKDILNITSECTGNTFYELNSLTHISEQIQNEEKQSSQDTHFYDSSYFQNQEKEQNITQLFNQPDQINEDQQISSVDHFSSYYKPHKDQIQPKNQAFLEEKEFLTYSFSSNSQTYQQQNLKDERIVPISKKGLQKYGFKNSVSYFRDLESQQIQEQTFLNQNENFIRNEIFHLSMRKMLYQLYHFNPFIQQYLIDSLKETNYQETTTIKEVKFCQVQCEYTSEQKKFIIYSTDKLYISRNLLFKQLCLVLFQLNVQLIIFSNTKSSNFLEDSPDSSYALQDKDIIKIFYSIERIQSYIQNQRDKYWKSEYPTIIQHF